MKVYKSFSLLLALSFCFNSYSQQKNLAEKLGFPKDTKLLILHADDVGLSHSEDSATITAFEKGGITSASIMVPCPWFPEIAAYAKQHPEFDWGIHLTFTSEWKNYKWNGVAPSSEIPGLIDKNGYMHTSVEEFGKNAKAEEVEKEIRAEIQKATSFGIRLTHLDNHMGSILASPDMITVYQKIGKEYHLPVLAPMNMIRMMAPQMAKYIDTNNVVVVDNFVSAYPAIAADKWKEFYNQAIQNLKPGLNEIIFHLAYDNDEMKAITIDHPDFGSAWRQRDFDYVTSDEFKNLLKQNDIHLITWGDIQKVMYKAPNP
ncbi:MAG TPA: polysaccharide deacetylase family protein [Chitinophagaceae bacterium]|jgi:hypothetical protein